MAKGEGSVIRYNKKTGVVIEGFDDLTEDNLDVLSAISHSNDKDNKRAYFRKKKSAKPKSKRKTKKDCGCK